jgi:hypothetical protein
MLLMKMQEPLAAISKETRHGDDEFVAVLSDHKSDAEVCAWSGAADGVVVEFEAWLDKKYPLPKISPVLRTIQQCE